MNISDLPSGPFSPGQAQSTYFALYADDCLLHFKLDELTPRQREDHEANIALTAMLQVALIYMGRNTDHAALHDTFAQAPWDTTLDFYASHFKAAFGNVIPPENCHYFPREGFYEAVAKTPIPTELLNLYMVSGSNLALHNDAAAWRLSQKVNSKMHFAAHAPQAGLPVPDTLVVTKATLATEGARFFARYAPNVMLKIQGLAGSRNVTHCADLAAAQAYVAEFEDTLPVLLQQRLDASNYNEMTVDLNVTDSTVEITNTRKILFADGLWVGNYLSPEVGLSEQQRAICLQVGDYVRELGYTSTQGFNCGIDFFIHPDKPLELTVIEINARWTGGLFPAQLIERLGAQQYPSVAFIDIISVEVLPGYLKFIADHGVVDDEGLGRNLGQYPGAAPEGYFRIVPMGFSPFTQTMDGTERMYVWQVVIGNFTEFVRIKNQTLGTSELPTANLIRV